MTVSGTTAASSYDRRFHVGYEKRGKFYRSDYIRSANYDFDNFGGDATSACRHYEGKLSKRLNSENVFIYDELYTLSLITALFKGQRPNEPLNIYEREKCDSFEGGSSTISRRQRRSFGSGGSSITSNIGMGSGGASTTVGTSGVVNNILMTTDPYGDFTEHDKRYVVVEKPRIMRKSMKNPCNTGDLSCDQESELECHRDPRSHCDVRNLPRNTFISGINTSVICSSTSQNRLRKITNGSGTWDSGGKY